MERYDFTPSKAFNSTVVSPNNHTLNHRQTIKSGNNDDMNMQDGLQSSPKRMHECPLCETIMVEPCNIPTGHIVCSSCLQASFEQQREANPQVQLVCPVTKSIMPRAFQMKVNRELQALIKAANPEKYMEHYAK